MKRSLQEIVELVIFFLIALVVVTGLLWVGGWLLGLIGFLFKWVAGLLWFLLRYVILVVIIVAAIYALVRLLQRQSKKQVEKTGAQGGKVTITPAPNDVTVVPTAASEPSSPGPAPLSTASSNPTPAGSGSSDTGFGQPAAAPVTTIDASGEPIGTTVEPSETPISTEPIRESAEPVPTVEVEPVPSETESTVVEESTEPIEVVEAEPVEAAPEHEEKAESPKTGDTRRKGDGKGDADDRKGNGKKKN